MDIKIPPLKFKILLESKPLKSRISVRRLAVVLRREVRRRDIEPQSYGDAVGAETGLVSAREGQIPSDLTV